MLVNKLLTYLRVCKYVIANFCLFFEVKTDFTVSTEEEEREGNKERSNE